MKKIIILSGIILSIVLPMTSFGQGTVLIPNKTIEKKMLKGENHLYIISLKKGEYAKCEVIQKDLDLVVDIIDPVGKMIKSFDSTGIKEAEKIYIEALQTGNYKLKIYPYIEDNGDSDSIKSALANKNQGDYAVSGLIKLSVNENQLRHVKINADKDQFTQWIKNNAHEIKTVDAGNGFEDLQPFKSILKGVRVVGLGEATHGTSEFFRMKHRMVEFLVKEMGFTSFYLEASMTRCRYINDYVLYGKGDPDTAVAIQGFKVWRTEEVKNMIEWMRQYNVNVPDENKVKFLGYDLQVQNLGWKGIKDFYTKVDKRKLAVLDSLQKKADTAQTLVSNALALGIKNNGTELYKTVHLQCLLLMDDIVLNEGKYKFLTGIKMYEENLMNIKLLLEESEIFQIPNYSTANDRRDYFMAENILSLLNREKPNAKVIVWAHNLHIAKTSTDYRKAMGSNLSDMLKSEYYAIGFEFYSGSFRSTNMDLKNLKSWDVMSIGDPPVESLPWYFNITGINKFFIDFRNTGTVNIKNFSKFYLIHSIGASYSIKWPGTSLISLTDFDGMFSFKESTASKFYDIVKN